MKKIFLLIYAFYSIITCYSQTSENFYNGVIKYDVEDYLGAIKDFNKAIEIDSKYTMAYKLRADAKLQLEDYRGAIVDYTKVIKMEPNNTDAYKQRATAKNNLKDYIGAIEDMNKLIQINADVYKQIAKAKNTVKDAIELNRNNAEAYLYRALLKGKLNNYQSSILDYNKAIHFDSKNAEAYIGRGLAKIKINQKDSGCLDLSKAGELGYAKAYDLIKESCQ